MRKHVSVKIVFLSLLSLLVFSGCWIGGPSGEDLVNANFGSIPSDYQNSIKSDMELSLIDSESARYKFGTPYKAYSYTGSHWDYGYGVQFMVNSKNRYGGYVGYKGYSAFFRPNQPILIQRPKALGKL